MRIGESRAARQARHVFLVAVLVFMAAPSVIVVINAFNASPFSIWPPTGLTLDWFHRGLGYAPFQRGLANALWIALATSLLVLAVGTPIAYAVSRILFRGKRLLRALVAGPLVVPRAAIGFALFVLFLVTRSGLHGTIQGMVLGHAILSLPFVVAILAANLGEIDPMLEEAARDLGATPLQAFRLAVLPQLRGGLLVAFLFAFITSFDEVETSLFLTRPVVNTLPVEMYFYLDQYQDPTIAAVSTLLILFSVLLMLFAILALRGRNLLKLMTGSGHA
jgi:putative spermidine/putrescine transport system permease protein